MYAANASCFQPGLANILRPQEHPVLRRLDALPQTESSGSSEFILLGAKDSQVTLDEVWTACESHVLTLSTDHCI